MYREKTQLNSYIRIEGDDAAATIHLYVLREQCGFRTPTKNCSAATRNQVSSTVQEKWQPNKVSNLFRIIPEIGFSAGNRTYFATFLLFTLFADPSGSSMAPTNSLSLLCLHILPILYFLARRSQLALKANDACWAILTTSPSQSFQLLDYFLLIPLTWWQQNWM